MTETVTQYEFIAGLKLKFYGKVNDPAHALGTQVRIDDGDTYEIVGRFIDSTCSANEIIIARLVEDEEASA